MAVTSLNEEKLKELFSGGLANLKVNSAHIDELNVFPIPDGDTGSNMLRTLEEGVKAAVCEEHGNAETFAAKFARGALLGARGNSGVILSQFIKGFSIGCKGRSELSVKDFNVAFMAGVARAYEAVLKPVEGTMLTVMREGGEYIDAEGGNITNFHDYFSRLNMKMNESLEHTPELLPILKESGVIDSGGAGFLCIFTGMEKALNGEKIDSVELFDSCRSEGINPNAFNADTELEFGYCTEFILQLQNNKVDVKNFNIQQLTDYLETVGNSIVAVKDDDLVKVHVHTFVPGDVLNFAQRFGEFVTLKIENMMIQHNENSMFKQPPVQIEKKIIRKPIAVVAVATGTGIKNYFEELGADICVDGGQTENPSIADFLKAFEQIDADHIIVLPCNSNIVMAAEQAAELHEKSEVHVIKAKTLAEGYSALSIMNLDQNLDDVIADMESAIAGVSTGLITTAVRDVDYEKLSVKKGHYIGLDRNNIISDSEIRLDAVKKLLNATENIKEKEVVAIFYGAGVPTEELEALDSMMERDFPWIEYGLIDGGQEVYDYILAIE